MWRFSCEGEVWCVKYISTINSTRRGQVVYEPFSRSGTCISAAEQLGRICWAIEKMPGYVDAAVTRWERLTGRKAELQRPEQPRKKRHGTKKRAAAEIG